MKIAMLTSDYLPSIGGIASHIYELSKALIANGNEVEVWVWDRKGDRPQIEKMGAVPARIIEKDAAGEGFGTARRLAKHIGQFVNNFHPDIIHVHTLDQLMPAMRWVKKEHGLKAVWTNHTSRYLRNIGSPLWRLKMRYYASAFDGLSTTCRDRLDKSLCLGIPEKFCVFISNGVDPYKYEYMSKEQAREALKIPNGSYVILYTGRFAPVKGVFNLAQAMDIVSKKIPNSLCVMCGNMNGDRESEKVRSFIITNNLENYVRMEGFIQNELLGPYLFASDALVLPSLMEATSISALEAMSVGRPVIGSRVGGILDLVDNCETGILVNPGDPEDLARAIIKFWEMPDREMMGNRSKRKVTSGFTWLRSADKMQEFYSKLTND